MLRLLVYSVTLLTMSMPGSSQAYYSLVDGSSEIVGVPVCASFEAARQWDTAYERWEARNFRGETSLDERQRMIHDRLCFFGVFKMETVDRSDQCMRIVKVRAIAIRQLASDDIRTHVKTMWHELVEIAERLDRGEEAANELVYIPVWGTGIGVEPTNDMCSRPKQ